MNELLLKRRSIRKYKPEPVSEEILNELLRAGFYAPSAVNLKPWHFILITDRKTLDSVAEVHTYAGMLKTAPAAIVVCGDLRVSARYWTDDCAAATENILIEATSQGLGSCWSAVYPSEEKMHNLSALLGIPEAVRPYSVIAVGYPDEKKETPERWDESRIHRNLWKQ